MVLRACRYFGHTREYWWANMTWSLYAELTQQLAEDPPTDRLVALYFHAQKWWSPPERATASQAAVGSSGEPDVWESHLPDFTE